MSRPTNFLEANASLIENNLIIVKNEAEEEFISNYFTGAQSGGESSQESLAPPRDFKIVQPKPGKVRQNLDQVIVVTTRVSGNDDDHNLFELLKEFEMEDVLPFLKASQITFRSLKYLKADDLKEAIPPIGLRAEFREKLFMWKKKEFGMDDETVSMPSKVNAWLKNNDFVPPSQDSHTLPYGLSRDLASLIQETNKGKLIMEFYKCNQHLTNRLRDDLINIVIDEVMAKDIILKSGDFMNILRQIINVFPNEKDTQEYYYIPRKARKSPSGRLYGKYVNQRSKKKKIYLEQNAPSPAHPKIDVPEIDFTESREIKASLSQNITDWNVVKDKWQKTFHLRQKDLKELTNTEFLQAWPKYSDSRAPELIKLDFKAMYPEKQNCLYSKWRMFRENIQLFYEDNLHNDFCKRLFTLAKASTNKGVCIKSFKTNTNEKFFINVCQTEEIPSPEDITEEQLADILQSEAPSSFRIPMSISDPRITKDKSNNSVDVCDIAINPKFFVKIQKSLLFKDFFLALIAEALNDKYNVQIKTDKSIILQNRKFIGTLVQHRVRNNDVKTVINSYKQPTEADKKKLAELDRATTGGAGGKRPPLVQEIDTSEVDALKRKSEELKENSTNIKQAIALAGSTVPEYKLRAKLCKEEVEELLAEFYLPKCISSQEITLDIGEDRILLESMKHGYMFDKFVNYRLNQERVRAIFDKTNKMLQVRIPVYPVQ